MQCSAFGVHKAYHEYPHFMISNQGFYFRQVGCRGYFLSSLSFFHLFQFFPNLVKLLLSIQTSSIPPITRPISSPVVSLKHNHGTNPQGQHSPRHRQQWLSSFPRSRSAPGRRLQSQGNRSIRAERRMANQILLREIRS